MIKINLRSFFLLKIFIILFMLSSFINAKTYFFNLKKPLSIYDKCFSTGNNIEEDELSREDYNDIEEMEDSIKKEEEEEYDVEYNKGMIGNFKRDGFQNYNLNVSNTRSDTDVVMSSMGGANATYEDPIGLSINSSNPAANFNLKKLLLTTNINYNHTFKNLFNNKNIDELYISNISLGFPFKNNFIFIFGYQPYTMKNFEKRIMYYNIKYKNVNVKDKNGNVKEKNDNLKKDEGYEDQKKSYSVNQGLNLLNFISGFKITDKWKLGLKNNLIFGFSEMDKYSNNPKLVIGLNSTLGSIYNYNNFSIGGTYGIENYYNDIINLTPSNITLGLGYGEKNNKWRINTQYSWKYSGKSIDYYIDNKPPKEISLINEQLYDNNQFCNYIKLTNEKQLPITNEKQLPITNEKQLPNDDQLFQKKTVAYSYNNNKISLGGDLLSNNNFFLYRGGLYYEYIPLYVFQHNLEDKQINYGINLGLGINFKKSKYDATYINFGINYGEKRTYENFDVVNRYIKFCMGFNTGIDI